MNKITIEEFVKRVKGLKAGEHISIQRIEDELIVVEEKKLIDYGSLKNERKNIQEKTKAFLDEVLLKHGERFDLKCNDYDSWEDAIDHEASNIANQLPCCVTCQDWSGDSFDLYLTSVKLVEGGHVAYVAGYSFDEGHGYEEDVKCSLYTGNLEAVADFVYLVLEEAKAES